ncbi:MAG: HAD-IA family hydrolase [Kiritimatiellae bacterium]|nr:HAD-IA family hydrolase [Kiritimatiellia bacterium]
MNAVFFDVDGTLFDTRADLAATVNHTRRDLGLDEMPLPDVISHVGQGARYLLEHAIPESRLPYEEVWQVFRSHYAEHCCETVAPYPSVRQTLDELRRRGWLLGINTNKPNFAVRRILEKFGLAHYFGDAVVAGGDGIPLKPDPQSLRECAARLGSHVLSPRDWMVGDSWTDLKAAEGAGIKAAFCAFGFGRLNGSRYTVRLGSFEELLGHLKDAG